MNRDRFIQGLKSDIQLSEKERPLQIPLSDLSQLFIGLRIPLMVSSPLYWWKEFDTYKVGTVANSCSTMHKIHAKEFLYKPQYAHSLSSGRIRIFLILHLYLPQEEQNIASVQVVQFFTSLIGNSKSIHGN